MVIALHYRLRSLHGYDEPTLWSRFSNNHHCRAYRYLDRGCRGNSGRVGHNGRHRLGLGAARHDGASPSSRASLDIK